MWDSISKKIKISGAIVAKAFNPSTPEAGKPLSSLEASLVYRASPETEKHCLKKQNKCFYFLCVCAQIEQG